MNEARVLARAVLGLVLVGCANAPMPSPTAPLMRSFGGQRVAGYYVTPTAYEHYMRAELAAQTGRIKAAALELEEAVRLDGASSFLRLRLSQELLALGNLARAGDEAESARALDPHSAEIQVQMARVALRRGQLAEARQILEKAIAEDPTYEDAYLTLIESYGKPLDTDREAQIWARLAAAVPSSVEAHFGLGRVAQARGDVRTAGAEWRRACDLDEGNSQIRLDFAQLLESEGDYAKAEELLREAWLSSGSRTFADALVRLLLAAGKQGEARAVVDDLEEEARSSAQRLQIGWLRLATHEPERAKAMAARELEGRDSDGARLLLGAALDEGDHRKEAIEQLKKIHPTSAQLVSAERRLTRLLQQEGHASEGVELVRHSIEVVQKRGASDAAADLEALLGEQLEAMGEGDRAIEQLERVVAANPDSVALALALANMYERAGRSAEALATAERVLADNPESVEALNAVGYALVERGLRLPEARQLLERALMLRPGAGEVADSLGWLDLKLGRLDSAEGYSVRADRLAPADPEILEHLGELYLRRSDRERAKDAYRRALAGHPAEPIRRLCEERLKLLEAPNSARADTKH